MMLRVLGIVSILLVSASGFAAEDVSVLPAGTNGIGFAFPSGGGGAVTLSRFLAPNRAVRLDFGLDLNKKDPNDMTFGFSLEAGYRMYCMKSGNVAAFGQPSLFFARASAASAPVSIGPGYSIGAEYFFNNNLSFGVNAGLNFIFTDSFSSFRLNTGTAAIVGNFYL